MMNATRPENTDLFRSELDRLGLSQSALARRMRELGDPRPVPTILRSISNWCRGAVAVPGEMWVVVRLLADRNTNKA